MAILHVVSIRIDIEVNFFGILATLIPRLKRANFGHVRVSARLRAVVGSSVHAGSVGLP